MKQTKQVELPEVQKVEAMIVKLQDEYGLHQGDKANLTGREEDAADQTPVIFTRRDTLSLARMAEIIVLESAQAQQEAVNAERARLLPYLMNGYEDVDDFVSSNYRQFMNSSNDPDDDSIQMAELYEKLKSELEALQTKEEGSHE